MAKSATKKKALPQPDLFEAPAPRGGKADTRSAPKPAAPKAKPSRGSSAEAGYTAKDIEVLEGLEPVRRRPGMYIGGTDEKALHHLFAEVIDNSMDEALAGHADWIEVELEADGFISITDNGRGIPIDPHPEIQEQVGARSHHVHAACRRQIRLQGLRDLRRPARRRRLGRQCAVGAHGGRGRARAAALQAWCSSAAFRKASWRKPAACRTAAAPRSASAPTRRFSGRRPPSSPSACSRWRAPRPTSTPASRSAGTARRSCCAASTTSRKRPPSISPQGLKDYLAANLAGATLVHPDIFTGTSGKTGRHGAVEWAVAWTADQDGFLQSYCNTIPTPDGGTHESGPAHRAAARPEGSRRARRPGKARRHRHQRRRHGRRRLHAVGVRARAGIPGPDQGPPRHRGGAEDRRTGDQGPVRSLAVGQSDAGQQAPGFRHRARRGPAAPAPGKGHRAQVRGAQAAPARQARRLLELGRPKAPRSSSSRATRPAAAPSRRATAATRRSCRCAARSSTSPPPARTSWRRTRSSPTWSRRSAAAPAPASTPRTCATRRSSS